MHFSELVSSESWHWIIFVKINL